MNDLIRELLEKLKDVLDDEELLRDVYHALHGTEDYTIDRLTSRRKAYEYGDHFLTVARYGNANGFAFAVVASLMFREECGSLLDWSAYWGGCDLTVHEEDAVRWVAANGNKLSVDDAQHYFPEVPIACYRE